MSAERMEQMELGLRQRRAREDRVARDAAELEALLEGRPELRGADAEKLCRALGWTDRRLREAAEGSGGQVLSAPGVRGYRLARHTSVADFEGLERARYRSQIRAMLRRLIAMQRAVHGRRAV